MITAPADAIALGHPRVVYDLFREFLALTPTSGLLFSSLSRPDHIPEHLTTSLTLQHANVALLPADFFMKAFQEIRRAQQRDMRPGKIHRQIK